MVIIKKNQYKEEGVRKIKEEALVPSISIPEIEISEEGRPLLEDVQAKAHQIIAQAQSEAQETKEKALNEVERIREEAQREGLEEGKAEGMSEVGEHIKEALDTLNDAVKARKKFIKDSEGEILRLALKIAEQIIRSEVSLHRDVCMNIVSEAIGRVSDREVLILKVNHEDIEHIKKNRDRIANLVDGIKNFSIVEDNSVEPGGCIVETNLGFVDAKVSTKLKAIEEALKKVGESAEEETGAA
jgi:flagellar assembly protein FliH